MDLWGKRNNEQKRTDLQHRQAYKAADRANNKT